MELTDGEQSQLNTNYQSLLENIKQID